MKNKKLSARIGCVLGSVFVAVFSVFTFALSPVSVHADTSDLWDSELNAWLDVSMDYVAMNASSIPNSPAWYCSLQYMKYALNDNEQMIHAGDSWANLSPGYAYYYNDQNSLCGCMFPTNYDTTARYDDLILCTSPDFTLTLHVSGDAPDFAYYVAYEGFVSGINKFRGYASGPYTGAKYNFYVTASGGYFTNTAGWTYSSNAYALNYPINFVIDNQIPTITPTFTPSISNSRFLIGICGNYTLVDFTDISISDIALTQLMTPAQLHDYLVNDYVPAFETQNPGYSFTSVPSEPVETETSEPDSGGCNCHVEVNVEVNPTLELPSEWNEDFVDLETEHYTAPYEDMVIEPWKDLQEQYTTESLRKNTLAKRAGEDSETDDYTFVAPLLDDNIISTIGDYETLCEQLFTASGIKTTVCIVLSAGFVIRFISLK